MKTINQEHGSPYDRGSADAYYKRKKCGFRPVGNKEQKDRGNQDNQGRRTRLS